MYAASGILIVYQVGINKGIILRCTAYQISRLSAHVLQWHISTNYAVFFGYL